MMQFYNEENEISYVDENYLCHNILMKREEIYIYLKAGYSNIEIHITMKMTVTYYRISENFRKYYNE